jgi:hypothetical protein
MSIVFSEQDRATIMYALQQVYDKIAILQPSEGFIPSEAMRKLKNGVYELCYLIDIPYDGLPDYSVELNRTDEPSAFKYPKEKIRALSKTQIETTLDDCCSICCDNHTLIECITTQCGHCFGLDCFKKWGITRKSNGSALTCPLCKTETHILTKYRPRKNYSPTTK